MAHNFQGLAYCVRFKLVHGRDVTHDDTVAHLEPERRKAWRKACELILKKHGMKWTTTKTPIAEPYLVSDGRTPMAVRNLDKKP